ncbi:MAG: peroxidase [Alphaproteobacteria bacterium]|nr:peroxidase [Alphaproteobacteria bacterium]
MSTSAAKTEPAPAQTRMRTAADLEDNLNDIQGGLLREYDTLACRYVFYRIDSPAKGRAWLRMLAGEVTTAAAAPDQLAQTGTLNVALTVWGLKALGFADAAIGAFPHAFCEGMQARAAKLGDVGPSAPEHWEGKLGSDEIHVLVALSHKSIKDCRRLHDRQTTASQEIGGVTEVHMVDAEVVFEQRSGCPSAHFGFVDPISQPAIEGFEAEANPGDGARTQDGAWRGIKPGEFLLGYENELGERTETPGPAGLCDNGTFIVFRKAYQDVSAFREYLSQGALALWGSDDAAHQEMLAAKIVGRWRSGCPLALSPDRDDPDIAADPKRVNDFDYADDPDGSKCPLGAHLRRTNPRASKLTTTTDINRKRLLRRGLEYGKPLPEGASDDGVDRGQAGMFVVADIELQFEFIQAEWIGKGDFIGLPTDEKDPLVGANGDGGQFTVPGADMPFLFDLKQFVTIRGGEYFFVPGIAALAGIADGRFQNMETDHE